MTKRKPAPATFVDARSAFAKAGGHPAVFARLWRAEDHRLNSGTPVVPTLATCMLTMRWLRDGNPWFPLVITEGSYSVRPGVQTCLNFDA